jgi:hypothetical protein
LLWTSSKESAKVLRLLLVAARAPRITSPESRSLPSPMKRRRFIWCLAILVVPGLCAGCSTLKPDAGQAYEGEDATWGKSLRPRAKQREKFFFNEKSRQIEESLGL